MTLHDKHIPAIDQRAECSSDNKSLEQLEELRESAIVFANELLRRHRKVRELIVQIDQLIDATERFQKSLWGRS